MPLPDLKGLDYVHYTNSTILSLLPAAECYVCSVETLIDQYELAPLSGEIHCGGGEGLLNSMPTCFVRLNPETSSRWNRQTLLQNYGHRKQNYIEKSMDASELQKQLDSLIDNHFNSIMELTVDVLRLRQIDKLPQLPDAFLADWNQRLLQAQEAAIRKYILCSIAAKFFFLNDSEIELSQIIKKQIEPLLKKVPLDLLEKTEDEQYSITAEIFSEMTIMSFKKPALTSELKNPTSSQRILNNHYYTLSGSSYYSPENFIDRVADQTTKEALSSADYDCMTIRSKNAILKLQRFCELLKKVLQNPTAGSRFSKVEQTGWSSSFPIAFFVRHETHAQAFSCFKTEFRAERPLKLGLDITIIGILEDDKEKLLEFLKNNNLLNCITVIDIHSTPENTIVFHDPNQHQHQNHPPHLLPQFKAHCTIVPPVVLAASNDSTRSPPARNFM